MDSVNIAPSLSLVVTDSIVNVTCLDFSNGSIYITVSGGSGVYSYLWSDGNTNQNSLGLLQDHIFSL